MVEVVDILDGAEYLTVISRIYLLLREYVYGLCKFDFLQTLLKL